MSSPKEILPRNIFYLLFIAATIVYIAGLFVPVMEVDAAQYAAISREMLVNHHYLEVFNRGQNYLDKPPLLFWLCVISYKIFGVNTVAYKLPSFLFSLFGVYSTFRLAKYLYSETVGLLAALILYTCQAFFLFNNDVRTDTLLTANVIFAIWQLVLFADSRKLIHLLLGFLGVSLALLSKGPIGAVVPAAALLTHFILKRQWKYFFRWEWLIGILLMLVLLSPMVYGLYEQYGTDGPKFFFWTQSFGRITGESPWKNDTGYFNFVHVFGWSMLPWTAFAACAILFSLYQIFKNRFSAGALTEYYTLGGFVFPFIALSLSHYKLPHYIFVLFPLSAIITSNFILNSISGNKAALKTFSVMQIVIAAAIVALAVLICVVWFPLRNILIWIPVAVGLVFYLQWWVKPFDLITRIVFPTAMIAILMNWLLSAHAYPTLLKYQAGTQLASMANTENLPKNSVYYFNYNSYAFEFYFQQTPGYLSENDIARKLSANEHINIIGRADLLDAMKKNNWTPTKLRAVGDFHVSQLSPKFLDRTTRDSTLTQVYLMEF